MNARPDDVAVTAAALRAVTDGVPDAPDITADTVHLVSVSNFDGNAASYLLSFSALAGDGYRGPANQFPTSRSRRYALVSQGR